MPAPPTPSDKVAIERHQAWIHEVKTNPQSLGGVLPPLPTRQEGQIGDALLS